MGIIALNNLFEYITSSLSETELEWLANELSMVASKSKRKLEPYTFDEINTRINESEQQIASGECSATADVFRRLYSKYNMEGTEHFQEDMAV